MKNKISFFVLFVLAAGLFAQGIQENTLPLRRVVILTSGLAYYEHSGSINGNTVFSIPFRLQAVNDALKTLVINDPSANPSVTYQAENTLYETLRSLTVDISDSPDMAAILLRLRGEEAEIAVSEIKHTGRIAGIEYRNIDTRELGGRNAPWLLFNTKNGLMSFGLHEISSIKFLDPSIDQDLNRALDLIADSRNSLSRNLLINLPGTSRRNVSISYVIPSPVWKVSYRLDLSASLFQGWAIVDNDSDTDWNNVSLSLVAGRPSSFIQQLYPPYYVSRPVLPLSIAGTAEAATHERSAPLRAQNQAAADMMMSRSPVSEEAEWAGTGYGGQTIASGVQTAAGSDAGGQFEFTIKNPVSLNRRMSAMLPLAEAKIDVKKTLVYSGQGRFPRLGAEITNTSNMKLPAGPITVYDGGVYAGDALIEFWNENEKRLISFGEDLSVSASLNNSNTRAVSTVNVSSGVMTINRYLTYTRTYTFINSASVSKQLMIEHTKTPNTELVSVQANEQTVSHYRFNITLPANQQTVFTVNERQPIMERITLLPMRLDTMISYTTNQEIPANVRAALSRAVELKRAVDTADITLRDLETQRERLVSDQDRIRRNLEAAGQTPQGQEYLRRLVALDGEIDSLSANIERANTSARSARTAFENYINTLNL
ncbi:MAG: hypothetical protein FWD26_06985 [Treponema sp.]|nr:hypothetical protein [Treponema sp.]